jgi:SAM-dependent methyltransferase
MSSPSTAGKPAPQQRSSAYRTLRKAYRTVRPRATSANPLGRKLPAKAPMGVGVGRMIGPALPPVEPRDIVWVPRPDTKRRGIVKSVYDTGAPPPTFDIELLERLNQEYAQRKLVAHPPKYDPDSLEMAARRRVQWVHGMVDVYGKRTLEIGCGSGFEVWSLAQHYNCDAYGVDVSEYGPWEALAGERVHFEMTDLGVHNPFPPNHFDRVISFTVWEHVLHPYALLEETYKALKPGGLAWIRANLYAGPQASHRYNDIHFPWPHLLFTDDVIREWDRQHGREPRGSAWVNRLSWRHYEDAMLRIGFKIRLVNFTQTPLDREFYERFENVLGRFPEWDLQTDYFLVVLEKPA